MAGKSKSRSKSGVRVEISKVTIKGLKSSEQVRAWIEIEAQKLAFKANHSLKQTQRGYPDYSYALHDGEDGVFATVFTRSNHAKYSNAKHNTLVRLVG